MSYPHHLIYDVAKYIIHSSENNIILEKEWHQSYIEYIKTVASDDPFFELNQKPMLAVDLINYLDKEFEVLVSYNRHKKLQTGIKRFFNKKKRLESFNRLSSLIEKRDELYRRYMVKVRVSVKDLKNFLTVNPIDYDIKV